MLDKRGAVLETARRISSLMRENSIPGAVIGGVAVVLHGHLRTTKDVDVWIDQPLASFRPLLESLGTEFDRNKREFLLGSVPVHLVDQSMVRPAPQHTVVIDEITTVSLPDLITMKLRSGLSHITRAQDIADVIGLIRHQRLNSEFASKIDKSLRAEFKKLVTAVRRES
jgi:hypothetical protein